MLFLPLPSPILHPPLPRFCPWCLLMSEWAVNRCGISVLWVLERLLFYSAILQMGKPRLQRFWVTKTTQLIFYSRNQEELLGPFLILKHLCLPILCSFTLLDYASCILILFSHFIDKETVSQRAKQTATQLVRSIKKPVPDAQFIRGMDRTHIE